MLMAKPESAASKALKWFHSNAMKLTSSKCELLVCGHFECMICNVGNSDVIEAHEVKLLGVKIESDLIFKSHFGTFCKTASQKLNALSRLCTFIPFNKRKILMHAFFLSQFSYSPLVWMCHSRQLNTRINNLHYRALRLVYQDENYSFEELLQKDGSVTIHHRNLQFLAIEMYKVFRGLAPSFMSDIFGINGNTNAENVSARTRSHTYFYNPSNPKTVNNGLETLRSIGPKIWAMIPNEMKDTQSLPLFKAKIKKWVPHECPCRLCKSFIPQLGFLRFF